MYCNVLYRDPPHPCRVVITAPHCHLTLTALATSITTSTVLPGVKETIRQLLHQGYSSSDALHLHKMDLLLAWGAKHYTEVTTSQSYVPRDEWTMWVVIYVCMYIQNNHYFINVSSCHTISLSIYKLNVFFPCVRSELATEKDCIDVSNKGRILVSLMILCEQANQELTQRQKHQQPQYQNQQEEESVKIAKVEWKNGDVILALCTPLMRQVLKGEYCIVLPR